MFLKLFLPLLVLSLIIVVFISYNGNSKSILAFESMTNISLQQYDVEVMSEGIYTGAFGSDSYTEHKLSFQKHQFEKLILEIKNQKVISENISIDNRNINNGVHHFWVENDIKFSFIIHDGVLPDKYFQSIVIWKNEQVVILDEVYPR